MPVILTAPSIYPAVERLLYIAREGANPSVLFSCDKSKLPEMYQTDRDYGSILRFAIRSSLIDAVKIEGSLDDDSLEDIAGQAVDLGCVPIIVIRGEKGAKAADLTALMEKRWDLEAVTFELVVPVETDADIDEMKAAAKPLKNSTTTPSSSPIPWICRQRSAPQGRHLRRLDLVRSCRRRSGRYAGQQSRPCLAPPRCLRPAKKVT